MIESLIAKLITQLASWLFSKVLAFFHGRKQQSDTNKSIDEKLAAFKQVYKEAFDGTPVTPEQDAKLKKAIADFLRGDGTGL